MEEFDGCRINFQKAVEYRKGGSLYLTKLKFVLKEANKEEWEILAVSSIMDYIKSNGFRNMITLKKDFNGKPYYKDEDKIYLCYDHIEGSKLKLNTIEDGIKFAELIANFHTAGEGYLQPSGIKACVLWGKKTEEYKGLALKFEKNFRSLKLKEVKNDIEEYILEKGDEILKRTKASMKILKSTAYLKALESSMKKKEICLNKISRNIAVISNNDIFLKKVFDMGYNMAEEDVAIVAKKIIEESGNPYAYDSIIESYRSVRCIEDNSLLIIKAIAAFPEDTVKIADKYFRNLQPDGIILSKLKKYWSRESKVNLLEV